jgi:uncharacterized membrane protein
MAKTYTSEQLAWRVFSVSMIGVVAWVAASFFFVILRQP